MKNTRTAAAALLAALGTVALVPAPARAQRLGGFDAPRIDKIVLDGKPDDWGDRGLRVEALAPANGDLRPAADFAPRLRVAWDDKGLLVLATVRDQAEVTSGDAAALWQGDSVELFLASGRGAREWFQFLVSPDGRTHVFRQGSPAPGAAAPAAEFASAKVAGGYVVEGRLPWAALGLAPKKGAEVTFQVAVNDVDAPNGPRAQMLWYPEPGAHADPSTTWPLRLADRPSPPVTVAALTDESGFPRIRLRLLAPGDAAEKIVTAAGRSVPLAPGPDGWATAAVNLPRNTLGPVPLILDKKTAGYAITGDARALRRRALDSVPLLFRPAVFSGDNFPDCEFAEPSRVEDLIGPYSFDVRYFNAARNEVKRPGGPGRYGAVVAVVGADGTNIKRYATLYRAPGRVDWWRRREPAAPAEVTFPAGLGLDPVTLAARKSEVGGFLMDAFSEWQSRPEAAAFFAALAEAKPGEPAVQRTGWQEADRRWWTQLQAKTGDLKQYERVVKAPKGYEADTAKRWPLLLFLHGSGERGSDLSKVAVHGPLKEVQNGRDLPFLVVAPQCPEGEWWNPTKLSLLLDEVAGKYRVDRSRVYCTGLSMGGYGTWSLATEYPERFAAVAPICGGGDPLDAARLKGVPVWAFHGAKDATVPLRASEEMVGATKSAGGDAKLTVYPDAGHDSWSAAYATDELYTWLLSHERG